MKKILNFLAFFFIIGNCFGQDDLFVGTWTDYFEVDKGGGVVYKYEIVLNIKKFIKSGSEIRIGEVDVIANKKCHKKWDLSWYYPDKSLSNQISINFKKPDTTECDKKNMATNEYSHEAYMQIINANFFNVFEEEIFGSTGKWMYLFLSDSTINDVILMGYDKKTYYGKFHRKNKINEVKAKKESQLNGWWTMESTLSNSNGVYATLWGYVGFLENGKAELSEVGTGIQGCVPALKNHKFTWWVNGDRYYWKAPNGASGNHPITWFSKNQFTISDVSSKDKKIFTRSNSEYDAKSWYNSKCQVNCPEAQVINNKQTSPKIKNQEGTSNSRNTCVNCNGTRKATCSDCSGKGTAISYKWETRIVTEYDPISGQTITREAREYLPSNSQCTRCSGSGRDPYLTCPAHN